VSAGLRPAEGSSVLFRVGGLVLGTIAAVVAISFGVALLIASPANPRMTVAEARDALVSAAGASELGLTRSLSRNAPFEPAAGGAALASSALAQALNLPEERVRVRARWERHGGAARVVRFVDGRAAGGERLGGPANLRDLLANPQLRQPLLSSALRMSVAAASVRQGDGRWLTVEPRSPASAVWRLRLLVAFGLSALLLAPLAWLAARRMTQPIRALADYARAAELGGEPFDSPDEGPREVREAATAIADMRLRLQKKSAEQTRMLAAVAHDLRTPLTGLRLRAETAPEEERRKMADDIARMEAMIAQVLAYASEGQGDEQPERIDLSLLVEQVAEEARQRGGAVDWRAHPPVFVSGAPLSLERAFANLIDNALRYAGAARVSLAVEGELALVTVADRGPGLPPELTERVKEPFYRAEGSRSLRTGGVGLGLTIARDSVERHGGSLVLRNRGGGGLAAEVRLPLATL
jgi:signal transduction histidine kinase